MMGLYALSLHGLLAAAPADVLWVDHRNLRHAQLGLHLHIKPDPIKTAMFGIWIDSKNCTGMPAFPFPKLCIQINLNPVANLKSLCHQRLRLNQNNPPPTTIMTAPLIAHCGSPVIKLPGRMFTPCRKKVKPARNIKTLIMDNRIFMRRLCGLVECGHYTRFILSRYLPRVSHS